MVYAQYSQSSVAAPRLIGSVGASPIGGLLQTGLVAVILAEQLRAGGVSALDPIPLPHQLGGERAERGSLDQRRHRIQALPQLGAHPLVRRRHAHLTPQWHSQGVQHLIGDRHHQEGYLFSSWWDYLRRSRGRTGRRTFPPTGIRECPPGIQSIG